MATITKGVKLRLYPNKHQQEQLWQAFGNARFVWNQLLNMAKRRYQNNPSSKFINEYGMNYLLKPLKREYVFLKDSDSTSYLVVTHNLALAFKRLFKHQGGYPRFKSKNYAKQAYTGRSKCRIVAKRRMKLPKIGEIRTSKTQRLQGCNIKQYTLSYAPTGKYYLSLQVEMPQPKPLPKTGKAVGLDVGIADLAISSDGAKYGTFNAKWHEKQAKAWQSRYSQRKHHAFVQTCQYNHEHKGMPQMDIKDWQNWQRAREIKARYQTKIADERADYLHKLTTALIKQYDVIVIEDLKAKNLQRNHHLAKSITNAAWRQFRIMLEYKCEWYGKRLVVVSPNYTSQICSRCGCNSGKKPLEIREWTCPRCGVHHDRDINAAVNILNRGLKAIG